MPTHAIATTGETVNPTTGELDGYMTKFKSYVAILTSADSTGVTVIVVNSNDTNYIGDIVWEYGGSQGFFTGTFPGAFPLDKTIIIPGFTSDINRQVIIGIFNDPDVLYLSTYQDGVQQDGNVSRYSFEIRVYQ